MSSPANAWSKEILANRRQAPNFTAIKRCAKDDHEQWREIRSESRTFPSQRSYCAPVFQQWGHIFPLCFGLMDLSLFFLHSAVTFSRAAWLTSIIAEEGPFWGARNGTPHAHWFRVIFIHGAGFFTKPPISSRESNNGKNVNNSFWILSLC